jgi:hypothetical protein
MEIKIKPITDQKLNLSKSVDNLLFKDMPINKWYREQERKRKNKKF